MNYPLKNHRDFEKPSFVFFAGGPEMAEKIETETSEKEKTPATPKEWGEHFKDNYEPDKWRAGVEKSFQNELKPPKDTPQEIMDRLANDSVARYESKYAELFARIYKMDADPEKIIETIKEKQTEERERLAEAVKNLHELYDADQRLQAERVSARAEKTTWVHKIPIAGKFLAADIPILSYPTYSAEYRKFLNFREETVNRFDEFLEALGNQYFNVEWQKDHLTEKQFDRYEKLAGKKWHTTGFQDGMEVYLAVQLDALFESEDARDPAKLKTGLERLRDNLSKRYEKYANKDGLIDLAELERVEEESKKTLDIIRIINEGKSDEEIYARAEFKEILNRDNWTTATALLTDQFIDSAFNNGTEAAFIAKISELTGKKFDDFHDAADELEDFMEKKAETGVKETIKVIRELNSAVNGERAKILALEHVKPDSIHGMVRKERDLLLNGLTVPGGEDEGAVVDFIRADRERRSMILKNPDQKNTLFRAIQNIKTHHEKKYDKEYKKSLPRKVSELTDSKNPDKPHHDNQAARLMAIITLGKEAEWIIGQMDQSQEFKDKNLKTGLENVAPDKTPPKIDMKFRDVNKLYSTRYVSHLSRGGFNGRDLALNAGKIMAGLTLFANLMQARKQKKLSAFFTNPVIYGSAAAIWGIGKIQENPEAMHYFSESEGGKERIATHLSLNSLARRVNRRPLKRFIGNADEWNAMSKIMENPKRGIKQLERLRDKARKTNSKEPVLTKKDLQDLIGDDAVWSQLPDTGNDRMRFLFYEKFLTSPRNIRELKNNCEKWK
ncbi:hypothetical protein JW752_04625 [Candidatus Peregrinibacteria bacterium]|nr:hypothetical protein [Candidatus Peregrinibacteria bacterium]